MCARFFGGGDDDGYVDEDAGADIFFPRYGLLGAATDFTPVILDAKTCQLNRADENNVGQAIAIDVDDESQAALDRLLT